MDTGSLLRNILPGSFPHNCRIYNLTGSAAALLLALQEMPFVAVEHDAVSAEKLRSDIGFYRSLLSEGGVLLLPEPNGPDTAGTRAGLIRDLKVSDSVVTSSVNLKSTLWDSDSLEVYSIQLRPGTDLTRAGLEESLISLGYRRVPMVVSKGEYSRRGYIIDIFPTTSERPLRVEFFGDVPEQVRTFDIETQRSGENLGEFLILPASEGEETRRLFDVIKGKKVFCLYPPEEGDYFPDDRVLLSKFSFVPPDESSESEGQAVTNIEAGVLPVRGHSILPEERKGIRELPENVMMLSGKSRVIIVASSTGQSERLRDMFREKEFIVPVVGIEEAAAYDGAVFITVGKLSAGVFVDGLVILTEKELFGERPSFRSMKRSKVSNLLLSIDDITQGDFVVHREHGIGRFVGVVRQKTAESEIELMQIEYEAGKIYIPVQNITNISKYRSEEGVVPVVDKLGGKSWQRKKERARKKAHEIAAKLMSLYAGRSVTKGYSFSPDTELHHEFDSFFAYEETPDQIKSIEEIKRDMEADRPMDRLLCGDVGYGKTEVAMRAVFKAVYDNRQAAVLVPTTILAEQHYRTFSERFSGFPVTIDFLSRFKSKQQTDTAIRAIARGETDIVIGTHSLLSKKLSFPRLGLLVIDEEHRFGVAQKEKIKELSRDIDVLNLTATPIPRTMHMALSGIRDISVIETPPEERLSVKSIVTTFNDNVIRQAVSAELQRDGQVFFVHNRIHDIHGVAGKIMELVPAARVAVAHGQMREHELERVMHRFFEGEINVLVSTAIIGAGLDIPRANTIIIDMADRMGLADLYQLRGRVGRSNLKGYAYFLAPDESSQTDEAKKRLQAIQEMSYLGAGFRLALKDLEIRGAGDIFGAEQSGHIHEVGFDLYIEMLEQAVAELKGVEIKEERDPVIELNMSALIPEEYIEDMTLRLGFYRRIAGLREEKEAIEFETELRDRFGSPPAEVSNLIRVMKLKILCRRLSVTEIREKKESLRVIFSSETPVQPAHILSLHDKRKKGIKFLPDGFELSVKVNAGFDRTYEILSTALIELCKVSGLCINPAQSL